MPSQGRLRHVFSLPRVAALIACAGGVFPLSVYAQPVGVGGVGSGSVGSAPAAPPQVASNGQYYGDQVNVAAINGRDFAGIKLAATTQRGEVVIRAARAWVWTEGSSSGVRIIGNDGLPVGTQRIVLQGDVSIELAGHRFTAPQAVLWSQTLAVPAIAFGETPAAPDQDLATRQIAVFFDRVSDPGAQAGYSQAADRLLVTGVIDGSFALKADALTPGRPTVAAQTTFLVESEQRLARYLRELVGKPDESPEPKASLAPGVVSGKITPGFSRPYEPNSPIAKINRGKAAEQDETPIEDRTEPLFAKDGIVTFAVGTRAPDAPTAPDFGEQVNDSAYIRLVRGEEGGDNSLILTGGVAVQYTDLRKTRNLLISAERAVIFMPAGPLTDLSKFASDQLRGIYLEGDVVATDGQYTLRGPRVFYDFQQNRAVMADAVFSTVDAKLGIPIYVRARTLRQEAANQVKAEGARLSTSSFFEPVFTIGAKSITVTEAAAKAEGGRKVTYVDAQNITLRGMGVPFFWLPGFKGEIDNIPLRDVRVDNSSGSGAALKTTWNAFGLMGMKAPEGVDARLLIDYYFDRGFAAGTRTDWATPTLTGQLFAYTLVSDNGRDVLSNGTRFEQDQQFRGAVLAENRWDITPNWSLFAEVSKISDEQFIDGFFKEIGSEGREVASDIYLRYIGGNSHFSALIKGTFDNFTPNQYLLQSQGYTVNKLPEIKYARLADDVLPGIQPGLLTWTHEYDYSRIAFKFTEPTIRDFGFNDPFITNKEFGINPNQSPGDRLRAAGFNEQAFNRADTRQELSGVFDWSFLRINPFVVGRFTGYDKKIEEISAFSPDGDKLYRAWWAAGARFSTEIERIDDSIESSFFDLHRIRHIITPSATVWTASSTIREESLPIYDDTVEALATGSAVRTGVSNVWQTQRGGPGRWHSVDVLKINTDFTFATADRNTDSPFGRFFDNRPEYSFLGNYFTGEATWQATDAVGLVYSVIYDFDKNQTARTTAGGVIQHSPEFSTYAQVRYLNPLNATYVDAGLNYQLTRVYSVGTSMTYDTNLNEIQTVSATLRRRFQDASVGVRVNFNSITEETSVGVVFEPQATVNKRQNDQIDRLRNIGR